MKKVLFLHGRGWNGSENWFPWLKKELESKKFQVFNPEMPNTNNPKLYEQLNFISKFYKENKDFDYIVGHSLWCLVALNLVEKFNISKTKIILVAPAYPWIVEDMWKIRFWSSAKYLQKYFNHKIEFKKLNNKYTIFLSNNDPFISLEKAKNHFSKLENVNFYEFDDMGHFNEGYWVYKLDELLQFFDL